MRIGLLGTGPWAGFVHAPALAAHPDVTFAGLWGRRPEAAAELAAVHGVPAYPTVDALLADVDAVAIALPPDVQAEYATRAAQAGKHLLLDKPVAATVDAARAVEDAVAASGVATVVFFTTRFGPAQDAWIAEQAAQDGWFTAHCHWIGSVFTTDSPYAASPWRQQKGALWDVGPHALSVLLPVLGEVDRLTAAPGPGDTTHLVLRHRGGASSTVTLSLTAPPAASADGAAVELRGTAGVTTLPGRDEHPTAAFARALDGLLASAKSGEPHPCDIRFGRQVVEVLAAAEEQLLRGGR
ncbi:Gfo/Idh/MocA family oxidoreductase [Kitasatospora sp. YST-16]|uniref:Gfo/Idh/MocA family protein n=1 Tax=unclassified Kitasatospora TaxID=2633591 RepID=UPI0004C343C9|nr:MULTISPECIES: Gfo/Idh/MocA family oxidoreductase [unclassified Kitasatospora]WAL70538.1 Gfo/Idh/MocA family oxidoreductase [Kitasatospora sp. YST-16]WNW36578.1 Gfo/Idh/MocA family oxidoreductase [Streptomyces sp. Li-HN-5-13]